MEFDLLARRRLLLSSQELAVLEKLVLLAEDILVFLHPRRD